MSQATVGRPRKKDKHLPPLMVVNRNNYYYLKRLAPQKYESVWLGHVLEANRSPSESLAAALEQYRELAESAKQGESLRFLIKLWREKTLGRYEASTQAKYIQMSEVIFRAPIGGLKIAEIRPSDAATFIDGRFAEKPITANKYRSLLINMFDFAVRRGWRDSNPIRQIKALPEPRRKRYVTDEELLRIIAAAPPMLKALIELGALTGQRISDLLRLEWSAVSPDAVLVDIADEDFGSKGQVLLRPGVMFHPNKTRKTTGKRVPVAMTEQLHDTLTRARKIPTDKSDFVIRGRDGLPWKYTGAYSAFKRAVDKAYHQYLIDCAAQRRIPRPGIFENLHFHDLKRRALTDAKNQGHDAQALGGHASAKMTERYFEQTEAPPTASDWIMPPKMPF